MPNILDFGLIFTQIPTLLAYLPVTLFITVFSMLFGVILGLVVAVIKMHKIPVLSQLAAIFVSFIRGTPLLVQLYLSFYGIPVLLRYVNYLYDTNYNVNGISPMIFVLIAFSLNEAAYNSETIRAALQSVNKGQIEAAQSLGMTYSQLLRRIVIPEAFLVALPNLGNTLIGLLKGTSLAFVCSVTEMTGRGKTLAGHSYRYFEVYISLALIYWGLTIIIELMVKYLEKRLTISDSANTPSYRRGKLL
ncbi:MULTISPECIES: amino acid ABC transporter permease [unclassified Gilliamella]|uniref:amino acid ABC transporter permease n=1 Tax=unclassified Gilliamella TaxID=2685620 RepID=UPI00226AF472|nr:MULTISPECIES: amino acid ABC transporter permease [unclassified Gilliamella]MCX8601209.1 amino acid ABC transporter permease [Gilliamella sp. B3722]MCX8607363.1 amino acid ABC transporter permease [Gilliamella sp. B3771]MCX8610448.1 amino acid ABC transporter permease [Gilliamella sp. B3891]MCX8612883.1 amino acid ABC transporter permease [Gilliamella sp. B3773]MCX8614792.1 amino acid ABC transporter permease [Gilliamella sp. B3770]